MALFNVSGDMRSIKCLSVRRAESRTGVLHLLSLLTETLDR